MRIIKRVSGWLTVAVFATVGGMVASDPAFAKTDMDKLTMGGEIRIRYEFRTNTDFVNTAAGKANESAASHRVRVNVGYDLTPDVSFFAQLQDARIWGAENNAFPTAGITAVSSANGNGSGVDLHQGYILVKNVLVPGLSLKAGRQELIYGDHRLLGNFSWSQIGNTFDAVKLMYSTDLVDVDLFWARIFESEIGAASGACGPNCTGVIFPGTGTTATTDQDLYGAYVTLKMIPYMTIEPYYFLLEDHRLGVGRAAAVGAAGSLVNPQAADQARSFLGGRINGKAGGLDATLEADWQFGSIASGSAGTGNAQDLHVNAHQEAAKIGFTFDAVPMKPRIGFEFDYASGDGCVNRVGGASCTAQGRFGTADNLFPTNHGKFGYMDLMAWRNMVAYQGVFDVKPSPVSKLQVNFAIMRLARTTDNWYRAGQVAYVVTGASNQEASLGQELDVHYWHTIKEKFKFEIGYGHFFTGAFFTGNPAVNNGSGAIAAVNGTGFGALGTTSNTQIVDQNWGYVMGSILF